MIERLAGYAMGDGSFCVEPRTTAGARLVLSGNYTGDELFVGEIAQDMGWKTTLRRDKKTCWKWSVPQPTTEKLLALGMKPSSARAATFPQGMEAWATEKKWSLLSGLWQSDGSLGAYRFYRSDRNRTELNLRATYSSTSENFLAGLRLFLGGIGVEATYGLDRVGTTYNPTGEYYMLRIGQRSIREFVGRLDLRGTKAQKAREFTHAG